MVFIDHPPIRRKTAKRSYTAVAVSAIFFMISISFAGLFISGPSQGEENTTETADWTFMVYQDGDNNLESAAIEDINEMEMIGSSDRVNIIVLCDRIDATEESWDDTSNGNWHDARIYRIEKDEAVTEINSELLAELGEVNMGDPETLINFTTFCFERYPAKHYLLSMWDHGGAFYGVCWDDSSEDEEGNTDRITMKELNYATDRIQDNLGRPVDVIGFDACLMSQIAVLYEISDNFDYVIASGFVEPGDGWPYEHILNNLVNDPSMEPQELGNYIAKAYTDSYTDDAEDPSDSRQIISTCFKMEYFDSFIIEMDKYAMYLSTIAGSEGTRIYSARTQTTGYDMAHVGPYDFFGYALYDIIDFSKNLIQLIPLDNQLREISNSLSSSAKNIVSASYTDKMHTPVPNRANGLTIYFPNRDSEGLPGSTVYDKRYEETSFGEERFWDEFLVAYHDITDVKRTSLPPSLIMNTPSLYNKSVDLSQGVYTITGMAYDFDSIVNVFVSIDDPSESSGGETADLIGSGNMVSWSYIQKLNLLSPGKHIVTVWAKNVDSVVSPKFSEEFYITDDTGLSNETDDDDSGGINFTLLLGIGILSLILMGIFFLNIDKILIKKKDEKGR